MSDAASACVGKMNGYRRDDHGWPSVQLFLVRIDIMHIRSAAMGDDLDAALDAFLAGEMPPESPALQGPLGVEAVALNSLGLPDLPGGMEHAMQLQMQGTWVPSTDTGLADPPPGAGAVGSDLEVMRGVAAQIATQQGPLQRATSANLPQQVWDVLQRQQRQQLYCQFPADLPSDEARAFVAPFKLPSAGVSFGGARTNASALKVPPAGSGRAIIVMYGERRKTAGPVHGVRNVRK